MIVMGKTKENTEKVIGNIQKFGPSNADQIFHATGVAKIQIHGIIKTLLEEGKVVAVEGSDPKSYVMAKKEAQLETPESSETTTEEKPNEPKEKAPSKKKGINKVEEPEAELLSTTGRNNNKLKFNGELYGKGRLVHAVIKKFIEDNPKVTLTKLSEAFPNELQPRYGMFQEVSKAKKMSEDRDRFFLKPEDLIKVGDKKIAVCNQFGSHNLPLKHFKSLGFVIK